MPVPRKVRAGSLSPDEGATPAAFELKGTVSSLTVLRLRTAAVERIAAELAERVAPFPQLFLHAPVVVDAGLIDGQPLPWKELARALRDARLVPVAAAGLAAEETDRAVGAGFGILQLGSRLRTVEPEATPGADPEIVDGPPPVVVLSPPPGESLVVGQPVRGGQVVYARGVDLVAHAPVNAGAQVIADGSIHVWAPLRGRALAGAQGRKDVRIFCLSLEAELLSVAGEYVMAEEIPDGLRGRPAQVFLDGERVRVAPL